MSSLSSSSSSSSSFSRSRSVTWHSSVQFKQVEVTNICNDDDDDDDDATKISNIARCDQYVTNNVAKNLPALTNLQLAQWENLFGNFPVVGQVRTDEVVLWICRIPAILKQLRAEKIRRHIEADNATIISQRLELSNAMTSMTL